MMIDGLISFSIGNSKNFKDKKPEILNYGF